MSPQNSKGPKKGGPEEDSSIYDRVLAIISDARNRQLDAPEIDNLKELEKAFENFYQELGSHQIPNSHKLAFHFPLRIDFEKLFLDLPGWDDYIYPHPDDIDLRTAGLTTREIEKYLPIGKEQLRAEANVSTEGGKRIPAILLSADEIAITDALGRGKGKGYRYARAKSGCFDCLDLLLSTQIDPGFIKAIKLGTQASLRQLLRHIRDNKLEIDTEGRSHLIEAHGFTTDHNEGLLVALSEPSILNLFSGSPWAGGQHFDQLRHLRRTRLSKWCNFKLSTLRAEKTCLVIPWSTLVIDLLPSRE
jgi:hypothetical protein